MDDTSVKIDKATQARFKALADGRNMTVKAYLADLAEREERAQLLDTATAAFRRAIERPGFAQAFDRDFGGLPQIASRTA